MKSHVVTRRTSKTLFYGIVLVMIIFVSVVFCKTIIVQTNGNIDKKLPIYYVDTKDKKIALTFDCAWENSNTQEILDLLSTANAKATFFVTGDFCERHPNDVKMLSKAGHSIQNHSNKHPHVKNIEKERLIKDTTECDKIIENITGKKPTLYRAPYGEYSNTMLSVFETDLKHKVIQWNVDSVDWKRPTPEKMNERILKGVKPGSILLFHNDIENTTQALTTLLPTLRKQGYEFVLVEDLIYKENYYLDHEGKQVKSQ
ncbi:polysaccharide deacetylase family protein [Paludicola sp. MB14-C6]|uniref:polysaccharide deacetylase family protein n=1 Tax=Paludihabitans sp. MB14-C6 TaxID=3070656 RepID=UPI0027DE016E|nr:polysaccharide deacetylase family protein [Paludicola sp. MB14-C6]WMJ22509.1 polysaccharide deacetylase family protein [Paludicola sp. MB14-C6]